MSPTPCGSYSQLIAPEQYDQWYRTPRGEWIGRTEAALLEAFMGLRPGDSLLDVGCGTGYFTQALTREAGLVVAADRDSRMVRYAARHRGGGQFWLVADARALPFADDSFDIAISVTALCFVQDERLAIREMLRVARQRVVLGLLNRHSLLYVQHGRRGGRGGYRGARWHGAAEARSLFSGLAASDVRVRTAVFVPSGGRWARAIEGLFNPLQPLWGSFIAVTAEKARGSCSPD